MGAEARSLWRLAGARLSGRAVQDGGGVPKLECSHDASAVGGWRMRMRYVPTVRRSLSSRGWAAESSELDFAIEIELKSLILAQIERWRHALHMQVVRG